MAAIIVYLVVFSGLVVVKMQATQDVSGIMVQSWGQLGSYEVTVIRDDSADDLADWLESNGFILPASARPILDDYAQKGWCFATARIVHDSDGPAAPHPLRVTFPTEQPVYPMRLTGSEAGPLELNLYVIGEKKALVDPLKVWHCDTYALQGKREARILSGFGTVGGMFSGSQTHTGIGHPQVTSLMWPGCVLTHLRGTVEPVEMKHDFYLEWEDATPFRPRSHQAGVRAQG